MTGIEEALVVVLAFAAGLGGLVALLYLLWLILLDMKERPGSVPPKSHA
jgi:hypothetical protein